jgi:regulator of extracellular matrix RemA (YlzA/DUF370 family)
MRVGKTERTGAEYSVIWQSVLIKFPICLSAIQTETITQRLATQCQKTEE